MYTDFYGYLYNIHIEGQMDPTHYLWQYFMLIWVIALHAKEKDQSVKWGALSGHPVQFPDLTL